MKRALITGAGGQDGSLLAEFLLEKGYEVHGVVREDSPNHNLDAVRDRMALVGADLVNRGSLAGLLEAVRPSEIYNLASISFVPASWEKPVETAQLAAVGVTALLEAIREVDPSIRFYQASSSEVFGEPTETPQSEATPLSPLTPYGVAKAYGHFITKSYRRRYGLHASAGILYNHESPRRPRHFLPMKVAHAAAMIAAGRQAVVELGDLEARRDWGWAPDYVRAMWLMTQCEVADDYVIATGISHSVSELVAIAFDEVGLDWRRHVVASAEFTRGRAELHNLVGNPTLANTRLGWEPSLSFEQMVRELVRSEVASSALGDGAAGPAQSESPRTTN